MTAPDLPPGLARPEPRAPPLPPPDPRWREWYQAHARAVYGYIRLHVFSPDEAEDLTADTFLKAFRAAPRFDARTASVRTWMLAIARNTIRDHRRRTRRRRHMPLATLRDLAADHPSPEERLLWEEEVRRLLEALAQLPERDREILGLRYGAELAPAEIAQALGIREVAVRTRVWRARRRAVRGGRRRQPAPAGPLSALPAPLKGLRRMTLARRASLLAPAWALAMPLAAQQPDTVPRDTATLAPIVVTGARLPTARAAAPGLTGRTAVLQAADLDARGVRTLADALEQLPGVTTADELGAPGQMDVTLRGFQVSPTIGLPQGVTVYLDGVRVNEPDAHEVNFDLLPLEDVDRVEVTYGPSVLLGRNALGAAVNLVTRRGAAPAEREIEVSGGSFGRYELKARADGRGGIWDYYAGARYEHEDGWRALTRSRIATLFAKVGLNNGTWDATLSYAGADNRIYQAGSLPESVFAAAPQTNFTGGDYFAPVAHLATLNARRMLGGVQLAVNLFGRALTTDQFNVNANPPDTRERNRERIGGGAVQVSGAATVAGRTLRWLAGLDGAYQHTAVRLFAAAGGRPDSLTESVLTNEVDLGAFAGATWSLAPALAATLAGRYDYIRLPFEDRLDPAQNGLNIFRRLSPRVGLTWTGPAGHEVYASVSRGFRAPALVEIGCADPAAACPLPFALGPDPALKPVVATTYETGWHFRPRAAGWDLSADVYRTDVRDDIFFVASTLTAGYFQNIGATRRSGLELAAQWTSRGGVRVYGNYGYTRATFETSADLATPRDTAGELVAPGDRLPLVPAHRANAGVSLPVAAAGRAGPAAPDRPSLRLGLDARYVGRQWLRGDEANATRRLADYAVVDASLTADWKRFELRAMVRNVLDRRYASFGTFAENPLAPGSPVQRFLTPGLPRHVVVSLSADF